MLHALNRFLKRHLGDRRGNVTLIAALAMPVVVGSLGLGAEVASWYSSKRAMQNAADSAAIAAATNGTATSYDDEARAVAARYGYKDGVDGVTVLASNTATCPDGGNNCFKVTIDKIQPLLLAQAVGFPGDVTFNGSPAKRLSATAVAIQDDQPREFCVLALAGSGEPQGIRTNGAPNANLSGCGVMSNTNAVCNGHDLQADFGDAHGTNDGCGRVRKSSVPVVSDQYAGLASKIPADPCAGNYYKAPKNKKDKALPDTNQLSNFRPEPVIDICGDAQLTGPVLLNSGEHTLLIVRNGSLDLNNQTLETRPGTTVTIIFTGNDSNSTHAPIGGGSFDIQAPTTGDWKGVAIYQDPNTRGGLDIKDAGNSPTWKITGLVYLPHASVTLSGAVNKSSNGASCFGLVIDNLTVNGTGSILTSGQCAAAGLTLPSALAPSRGRLVS